MATAAFDWGPVPALMGIVNVTPNSFSDGGAFFDPAAAVQQGRHLAEAGAGLLDLGAEASSFFRAGVTAVDAAEQLRRLMPVLPRLRGVGGKVLLSIDTRSADVARACIAAGAAVINDISAATHDPRMLETVAATNAGLVLMHIGATYPANPVSDDPDILASVRDYLHRRLEAAVRAGIPRDRVAIDPGVGFGKTPQDNWRLALGCGEFSKPAHQGGLGVPVVLGASRKRFLDTPPLLVPGIADEWRDLLGRLSQTGTSGEHARDPASAALTALAARRGVQIHRVHHVTLARLALTL